MISLSGPPTFEQRVQNKYMDLKEGRKEETKEGKIRGNDSKLNLELFLFPVLRERYSFFAFGIVLFYPLSIC